MDNERPIEKVLRRYGTKRTEEAGAPLQLHPATRRVLQTEVTRRASRSRRNRESTGWSGLRRTLVFGAGALVLVGVYALVLNKSWQWRTESKSLAEKPAEVAKAPNPFSEQDSLGVTPAGLPAESFAPTASVAPDNSLAISEVPVVGDTLAESRVSQEAFSIDQLDAVLRKDAAAAKNETFPSASNTARFSNAAVSQRMARVAGAETRPSPVLNRFRMEQNGNELRVVDDDGSTYSGSLQMAASTPAAPEPADKLRDEREAGNKPASVTFNNDNANLRYLFKVSGTNRTLNQQVFFNGNIQAEASSSLANAGQVQLGAVNQSSFPQLTNVIITGKAQVGDKEVEINAAPIAP